MYEEQFECPNLMCEENELWNIISDELHFNAHRAATH
jgi:hypothetical protein